MFHLTRRTGDFTNLLDSFFKDDWNYSKSFVKERAPSFTMKEGEDNYVIELATPGVNKEDFKIEVLKRTIFISLETEKNDYVSKFDKAWMLPDGVKEKDISAKYENGILSVIIKKPEEQKKPTFKIKVL